MPLNQACAGKLYAPIAMAVTSAATQKYARACNDDNPRYFDATAPGGLVAPPMFAVVVTWLSAISAFTDPDLRADLMRLLHVAHDMEFLAPIRPGDALTSTARIAAIETHPGGDTMALELEARNAAGDPVNRTLFTVLIRGRRGAAADAPPAAAIVRGEPLATVAQTIDRDQTPRYAEASGDRNPLHVDENFARMAGLPGIIVHGLCTMAFTSRVIIDRLCGGDPLRLKRLAVRFSRPVMPGDTITTRVWPAGARGDRRLFAYETANPGGLIVIRDGRAEIAG
ncbi:MAG: MaoC family dehydratase N-terminal domain-containing protein [Candidatus Binataceae bacterium]|nr:MaoC family dehydratase N-terminal domain-containing protein [Candidatus Binataceae bacterium]